MANYYLKKNYSLWFFTIFFYSFIFISKLEGSLFQEWSHFLSKEQNKEILELALKTRAGAEFFFPEDDPRLLAIESLLVDYTSSSPEDSLHLFLKQELDIDPAHITIKELERNSLESGRDLIYLIYNLSNELILVVKGFHNKAGLASELSAMEKLYQLRLNHSTTVAPLAVGKACITENPIFLLAETAAVGKSLVDYAFEFEFLTENNKQLKLEIFKKILKKLAMALAELHMKASEIEPIAQQKLVNFPTSLFPPSLECQKLLEEKEISIPYDEIDLFCEELTRQMTFYFPSRLYVYWDLNWGNIFYDENSDQIIFIDTATFHWCLNEQGEPTQNFHFALYDAQVAFYMLAYISQNFSVEEVELLAESYSSAYCENMHRDNDEVWKIFWKTFILITFIDDIFESTNYTRSSSISTKRELDEESSQKKEDRKTDNISEKTMEKLKIYLNHLKQLQDSFQARVVS